MTLISGARLRSTVTRWTAPLLILVTLAMFFMPTQHANAALPGLGDCGPLGDSKTAPVPITPGGGPAGWFGRPDHLPAPEDPFAPGTKTTVYEQYGTAGIQWHTYDPGCGGSVRDPSGWSDTFVGNILILPGIFLTGLATALLDAAYHPTFMGVFDGLVDDISAKLTTGVFNVFLPLVILGVAAFIMWRARSSDVSTASTIVGWAFLVLIIASLIGHAPSALGRAADTAITTGATTINNAINGETPGSNGQDRPGGDFSQIMYESVLYNPWCAGMVGSYTSPTAKTYCPQLLKATALSWDEERILRDNPEEGQKIIDAKEKDFKRIAKEIQEKDPPAYEVLKGEGGVANRLALGIVSLFAGIAIAPFLIAAGIVMLSAYLIIRFIAMTFPALATIGVAQPFSALITGIRDVAAAAIINAILFAGAASISAKVIGFIIMAPNVPGWLGLVLALIISVMLFRGLRPLRRATALAKGVNPVGGAFGEPGASRRARGKTQRGLWKFAKRTGGNALSLWAADKLIHRKDKDPAEDEPEETQPATPTRPARPRVPFGILGTPVHRSWYADQTVGPQPAAVGATGRPTLPAGSPPEPPPGRSWFADQTVGPQPAAVGAAASVERAPRVMRQRAVEGNPADRVDAVPADRYIEERTGDPAAPTRPTYLRRVPANAVRDKDTGKTIYQLYNPTSGATDNVSSGPTRPERPRPTTNTTWSTSNTTPSGPGRGGDGK